jgi:phage terminase small subunit
MAKVKYDEAVKSYSKAKLSSLKRKAKQYYTEKNGEVSVKVLARVARVPQGYIREWMRSEDWSKLVEPVQLTPKAQKALKSGAEKYGLTEQEELFCFHYLKTFNATTSAIKAGYSSSYAHNKAYLMLKEDRVKVFLKYIKGTRNEELFIDSMRIVNEYIKIAFADMSDFVRFGPNGVVLKHSDKVDGQMVVKVKEGRDGVTIELADKLKALEKLERYLKVMPSDWKQRVEEKKVELMGQKLELEKQKVDLGSESDDDDGFLTALKEAAKEVWNEEEEEAS